MGREAVGEQRPFATRRSLLECPLIDDEARENSTPNQRRAALSNRVRACLLNETTDFAGAAYGRVATTWWRLLCLCCCCVPTPRGRYLSRAPGTWARALRSTGGYQQRGFVRCACPRHFTRSLSLSKSAQLQLLLPAAVLYVMFPSDSLQRRQRGNSSYAARNSPHQAQGKRVAQAVSAEYSLKTKSIVDG